MSLTLSLSSGVQRTEAKVQDTLATMKIAFHSNRSASWLVLTDAQLPIGNVLVGTQ